MNSKAFSITLNDKLGKREDGIDDGGLFNEWCSELCKEVFDP